MTADNDASALMDLSTDEKIMIRVRAVELLIKSPSPSTGMPVSALPRTAAEWKHLKEIEVYLASGKVPEA